MALYLKPTSVIKAGLGLGKGGYVQRTLQLSCYKHMDKYVPMSNSKSKGNLRTIVDLSDPRYIVYEEPYAHAQYVGYTTGPVVNYTTPGTGPYWDQKMWSVESSSVINEVQRQMKRGGH